MTDPTTGRERRPFGNLVFLFAAMIVSSLVLAAAIPTGAFHVDPRVTLHRMVYHDAYRPYVYRTLSPTIVRGLTALTPEPARAKIRGLWETRGLDRVYRMPMEDAVPGTWAILLLYLSIIGFAAAMRVFLRTFYELSPGLEAAGALLAAALIPVFQPAYLYDITNLLLFTVCLIGVARAPGAWYYPLFFLTCVSKETALLLPIVMALNARSRDDFRKMLPRLLIQAAIWVAVGLSLRFLFRNNPGEQLEIHVADNLMNLFTRPRLYLSVGDYLLPRNLNGVGLVVTAVVVSHRWRDKPLFLRRSSAMMIPMVLLALIFAVIYETRVFLEAFPVIYALGFHGALAMLGGPPRIV